MNSNAFSTLNIQLSEAQLLQFSKYADLLVEWNQKFNLTAITDREEIYVKHFADCLLLVDQQPLTGSLCDVGSGAGFPGIVLKIACPDLKITLLEPTGKRATFLNEVIRQLGLKEIEVVNKRAEDFAKERRESYDYTTARAVAALNVLSELCLPLTKVNGHFLAMKGPKGEEEYQVAQNGIAKLGGKLEKIQKYGFEEQMERVIIDIAKISKTDPKYPRAFGQIKHKPL